MKKLITLTILAALLTASLSSCFTSRRRPDEDSERITISIDVPGSSTVQAVSPSEESYLIIAETRYAYIKNSAAARLYSVEDTTEITTKKRFGDGNEDELLLIATSESGTWSKVQFEGKQYYVLSAAISTADLLGHNFGPMAVETTMYVYNVEKGLNLRKYPTTEKYDGQHDLAPVLASPTVGESVTVLATSSSGWYRVRYKETVGYIFSDYLSTTEPISLNTDFTPYITAMEETTMFVSVEKATVRRIPSSANVNGSWVGVVQKGSPVQVVGKAVVSDATWYAIKWEIEGTGGRPSENIQCYIHATCLASGASSSVDDYKANYPTLHDYVRTLYVSTASLNGRSTPEVDEKGENIVKNLTKASAVEVKAVGTIDGSTWALVQDGPESFYFVNFKYLTVDSQGQASAIPLTLEEILSLYTNFTACSKTATANADIVALNVPSAQDGVSLASITMGQNLQIVAEGYVNIQLVKNYWYVVQGTDGTCYFVGQSQVTVR